MHASRPATLVLSRAVRPGKADAFARWIDELSAAARAADGFAGIVRLGQTDALQHLLLRFEDDATLARFRASAGYRALAEHGDELTVGIDQVATGRDVDIELPSDASASPWKRFIVTWLSVLPVLLLVSTVVRTLLPALPPPVQIIISSLLLTSLLQWVILPRVQRAARAWMLKDAGGALRVEA
jgi:antibiotic biosynthesis monooxygenase (ABM) superfamily enzyme